MPTLQEPDQIPSYQDWASQRQKNVIGVKPSNLWGAPRPGHKHQGQDFGGEMDSDVGSADDGEVVFAGDNGNMGNSVKIRHPDGKVSVYGHLNKINVRVGDQVKRDASIGLLGRTGNAKGPNVHFELYQNNLPIDPAGTSLKPRIGVRQPEQLAQQPSPEIPAFDDWIKTRATATNEEPEQPAQKIDQTIKTPKTSVALGEGAEMASPEEIAAFQKQKAVPIQFKPASGLPSGTTPTDIFLRTTKAVVGEDESPPSTPKEDLTRRALKQPASTELGARVKIPFSPRLNPTEDDVVRGYLSQLGPEYVRYGEQFKADAGRNILNLSDAELKRDPDGSFHVRPTRGAVDFINAYVQSGGDIEKATGEAGRQEGLAKQAYQEAAQKVAPQLAEIEKERKDFGATNAPYRAFAAPSQRFGAGITKMLGGVSSLGGLTPNRVSEYLNTRSRVAEYGASLPPLTAEGKEIERGMPEKAVTALADIGYTVAQIVALKKATGLSMGQVMALEAALKHSDEPATKQAAEAAKGYAMGLLLEGHLSRVMSATAFGAPTAVESGQQYLKGEKSWEDVLLDVAVQGGAGFALAGGKKARALEAKPIELNIDRQAPSPEINVPESRLTLQAQVDERGFTFIPNENRRQATPPRGTRVLRRPDGLVYYDPRRITDTAYLRDTPIPELLGHVEPKSLATTEAVVARKADGTEVQTSVVSPENLPAQIAETQSRLPGTQVGVESPVKVVAERLTPESTPTPSQPAWVPVPDRVEAASPPEQRSRAEIKRAAEPDAGDPQFRGLNDDQLQEFLSQRPLKGTSREKRAGLEQRQAEARTELQRRAGEPPLEPVNAPVAGEARPSEEVPSFKEYVENRPGGGLRFESLAPNSQEMNQLVREYTDRYGAPKITSRSSQAPEPIASRGARAKPASTESATAENIPRFDDWVKQKEVASEQPAPIVPGRPTKVAAPARKELTPVEPITIGRESRAVTERGSEINSRYAIAEADKLVTSHDSGLRPNPDFPPELQPRERDRAASADQVSRIASNLRPEFLGESPKASEGAPIVGPDGIVESGNGRVLALRQAYESGNRGSQAYRRFLTENAEKLGLDPEAISSAKSPVLVRIRTSDVDRPQFVKEANEQSITSMSPVEQARSDATALKGPLLDLFNPSESGDIATAGNMHFVRAFMKDVVGPNEVNRYVTASGHISQEGVGRIRNAIFARAYGDSPEGLIALEKLAESPDNNVRNITTAMLRNAPGFASLKEGIDQGTRYPIDLAPDVSAAMSKMSSLRDSGTPISDYLKQGTLYGEDLTPLQKRLLQVFDENKRGANIIDGILRNYVRAVDAAGSPSQGGLFGAEAPPAKADFLEAAIKEAIHGEAIQGSLLTSADRGLPSKPAPRGNDPAIDTQALRPERPTLAEAPPGESKDNPVRRFDSTIDRLKTQEEVARQRLAERKAEAGKLFADPEAGATSIPQDIYDLVVVGASKLAQRTLSVAQFVDEMVREFGAEIRSRAREIFRLSQRMVADTQKEIRKERLSKEIADRLFAENVPADLQREALRIAARFRTTTDTQGKFLSGFKSRVGEMAKSYGAAGGELTNRVHLGDIARAHEMEAGNTYLSRIKDVYNGVKNDFERQRISEAVINALENRANADRYLDTPEKKAAFKDTKDLLDEFRTKLTALGYETRDDYFTHIRQVDILDQILSDAKDPREASLNDLVGAKSKFLQTRDDAKIEIKKDLPRVLFAYLKSVSKEIAYSDAVDYYYNHFPDDIPISLKRNGMDRAIKLMQNSLNPEQGRGRFYRVVGRLRSEQYRNFLAYNLKASAQNFTQVNFARMRWTKEATTLANKMWRKREVLTGPLADAIELASTKETPLMRFLEQFKGDDPSGTRGRFAEAFNKYDPFQRSEKRNWALTELGSIINSVVKRPEYKALKAEMGAEGAISELLGRKEVFDGAVREAATTAAETQVASNPAMRGEFYDAPLHRIIGMFTAFKTRQLQILSEALRSHEGINGARAQTILRRGLSGDAQPVEVLREIETQRKAMETMVKRARKFNEDLGIGSRQVQGMIEHLKTQERELNGIIKQIEPLSGSRTRSAMIVGKYFAKVAAISVFFNLFWDSVYSGIFGTEDDKDADERVSGALKRAFWDVLPSPFYGADPSKFLVSPVAPNFERSAPYGRITKRGLATDVVRYGTTVIPFAGVADRASGRKLSGGIVNVLAPKKEKARKAEY